VPAVTSTCSTLSTWFTDVPRSRRTPSAMRADPEHLGGASRRYGRRLRWRAVRLGTDRVGGRRVLARTPGFSGTWSRVRSRSQAGAGMTTGLAPISVVG
jgi:hypothetical protein